MTKPKMLQPRLKMAPTPFEKHGFKMAKTTGRDADPRRTLPLNSYAWQKLRASVLAGEPLCRDCHARGIVTEATDVDHHDGNPGNNDPDNLVPLCHADHSRKTAAGQGRNVRQGCDASGWPLDIGHAWNDAIRADTAAARAIAAQEIASNRAP